MLRSLSKVTEADGRIEYRETSKSGPKGTGYEVQLPHDVEEVAEIGELGSSSLSGPFMKAPGSSS